MQAQRAEMYRQTCAQFAQLDRVVQAFAGKKGFEVIRMYYFNETQMGAQRAEDAPRYTFAEIAFELGRDEKTVRRWRTDMVGDMAICLFGIPAAAAVAGYQAQ